MMKFFSINNKKHTLIIGIIIVVFAIAGILINTINKNNFSSQVKLLEDVETTENNDNWSISTVFYDSSVDGGVTPLTEINWDASDGSYKVGETRIITVQINYKNPNAITTYNPGTIEISIPNLMKDVDEAQLSYTITMGANDATHTGYEWDVAKTGDTLIFTNTYQIEEKANFEGSIQIAYRITPEEETPERYEESCIHSYSSNIQAKLKVYNNAMIITSPYYPDNYPNDMTTELNNWVYEADEKTEQIYVTFSSDSKTYNSYDRIYFYDKDNNSLKNFYGSNFYGKTYSISGNYLKIAMSSNSTDTAKGFKAFVYSGITELTTETIVFNYKRTYTHPWKRLTYTLTKKAHKINSLDHLPNASDYIWVKYEFLIRNVNHTEGYPHIPLNTGYVEDSFPEGTIILNEELEDITEEDNNYKITVSPVRYEEWEGTFIYVGYPISEYNESNNNYSITNTGYMYGNYKDADSEEYEYLGEASISLNLADYIYTLPSTLYSLNKKYSSSYNYYESYTGEDPELGSKGATTVTLNPKVIYTGKPVTIKFGDDLLFITDSNGNYRRLTTEEYYIKSISFNNSYLHNGQNQVIKEGTYDVELWIKRTGENDYSLYSSIKNKSQTWSFTEEDKIESYYFVIKDLKESIIPQSKSYSNITTAGIIINKAKDIATSGSIYNFAFFEVYVDNTLQNPGSLDLYKDIMIQLGIDEHDLDKFGYYISRSSASSSYSKLSSLSMWNNVYVYNTVGNITQNAEKEIFTGTNNIKLTISGNLHMPLYTNVAKYTHLVKDGEKVYGLELYTLLPKGMELDISEEELINSLEITSNNKVYHKDGTEYTSQEIIEIIKKDLEVNVINNYNNTNRTKIEIKSIFSDGPLIMSGSFSVKLTYDYKISYDSYLEYGSNWKTSIYGKAYNQNTLAHSSNGSWVGTWGSTDTVVSDNGAKDSEELDINKNGNTTEKFAYEEKTQIINSVISTHQDLTTYVKTSESNYSTGTVETEYGSEYEYKLRVRTGSSEATNLIIYTNLEETNPKRISWKGEFLGIDTSYAESKGYTVKTYYSEKIDATNLLEDASWKEYNDSIDKTKVKSLAFQYLDSNGNPAILPVNSLTYILIIMKAPSDENIKAVAYNNSWTEWNAIDPITEQPVDYITGINSNTVKVSLPNSIEPETIEIKLEKKWADNNNKLGLRPDSIKYNLIINGNKNNSTEITLYNTDINVDDENIWFKYIEADKYDEEGNIITYTIEEELTQTDNIYYVPSINNYSITNTLSKDLTINKKWLDNNNAYVTRPTSVIVKVLQNNELFKEIEITGELSTNEWTKTISVPIYDENGNEYKYTFEEQSIDGYISSFDSTTNTFTNTLSVDTTIIVTKNWKDNTNKYGLRPSNININIKQNNQVYKTITLSGTTDTWKSEELTIPMYDKQGIKYNYTIEEETVKGYGLVEYNQETLTITNTLKETITLIVTKNWIDDSNSSQTRPTNLSVTILQNNKEFKTITLSGNTNTWTSNIEVPKYDENQNEYTYTIKENNENIITEYSDVLYGEDGLTVTNKLNKNIDLTITKKWKDFDNEYLTRPDTVTINLYRNNILYQELTLIGENNSWSTKVTNVPAYDDNGKKYIYTIEEVSNDKLSKYEKITYDQTTLTVTNEILNPPKVTLYFTVQNGYTEAGSDEVKFDEEGYKKVLEKYNINGDEDYTYTFELQNVETGEIYKGQLTTSGVLTFENISYGTYRAIEGEDEYFDFVEMLGIVEIPGVSFKEDENGGIITIKPTGEDITYGVNIINKIEEPASNPNTTNNSSKIIIVILSIVLCITILVLKRKFLKN